MCKYGIRPVKSMELINIITDERQIINFENGSTIEVIKSEDSIRGKGWFINIEMPNRARIIFVHDKEHKMNLTLNKEYELLDETDEHYFIINDNGDYWGYHKIFFRL